MQFGTVQQAPSESKDALKFFGTRHTQRTDARGVRVKGATGSSGELIAWKSQLTSSSQHRAMCKPEIRQEGASSQDTSCLKRACSKKHSERRKPYSSRGCTGRSTSKQVLQASSQSSTVPSHVAQEALAKIACHTISGRCADRLAKVNRLNRQRVVTAFT
jgi:hypothetical protein